MARRLSLVALLLFATVATGRAADRPPIRVMSFNIRYGTARDGENAWERRRDFLVETIQAFRPDLLGTQETLGDQRDFLAERLPGYFALGVGRDDGAESGEMMAVYVRSDRFDVAGSGRYWLSETPDVVGSKSWDSSLPRMVTWVELRDKSVPEAPPLIWMNTHFDHLGVEARKQSARLIRQRAESSAGQAVLITGDFNSGEGSEPYRNLFGEVEGRPSPVVDTFRALPLDRQRFDDLATFSNFKGGGPRKGGRIDWIGVSRHFTVLSSDIDYTERDGRTPSDHFPVTALLEWNTPELTDKR